MVEDAKALEPIRTVTSKQYLSSTKAASSTVTPQAKAGFMYARGAPGRRGALPGEAVQRALALRHEPVRPEAGRGPALDRARYY